MKNAFIVAVSTLAFTGMLPITGHAKTFIRSYTYQASEADSKITARSMALNQVKTLLLEEIGVYIESRFEDTAKEDKSGFEQLTKQQIASITAGVTETKILEEKWDGSIYYINAAIDVNVDDVRKKVEAIGQDSRKLRELEDVKKRADDALSEIALLKAELAKMKNEKDKQKLQGEYTKKIEKVAAVDWYQMGWSSAERESYDDAISYFQKALEGNPEDANIYCNIGSVYYKKGNLKNAIESLESAIQINPKYSEARYGLGMTYYKQGSLDKALEHFHYVVTINPKDAETYYLIGSVYGQKGNRRQEIEYITKSAQLGDSRARRYLTDANIGW